MASKLQLGRLAFSLQARGVTTAAVLAHELGVSQPTLSRLLSSLGPRLERIGAHQSSRYALRRDVRNLGSAWPVYRVDHEGRPILWGELRALHGGFRLIPQIAASARWLEGPYPGHQYPGLPFLLQDVRPQGYIGRMIARQVGAALGIAEDPRDWSDDDLLAYLLAEGDDLPGDLVLGDRALERALRRLGGLEEAACAWEDREASYPALAEASQRGEQVGSSAAGEQPKFLAAVRRGGDISSVLVKFSPAGSSPSGIRWMDLLLCEHLAAELLLTRAIPASRTAILDAGGRRFLEVERFDRVRGRGRRGVLALGSVEDGLLEGSSTDWTRSAAQLEQTGYLGHEEARRLRWLWCFGDMIANSDMHRGNASVFFGAPPFTLAPAYDMLPMLHAPGPQGELPVRHFAPRPPMPAVSDVWSDAAGAAVEFWGRVAADGRISSDYRGLAGDCGNLVAELQRKFA